MIARWLGPRVPVVLQLAASECGLACLAMTLTMHGRATTLAELREKAPPGRDGLNARDLLDCARVLGLRGRAVRVDVADLAKLPVGSVLHWAFNHFVVLERVRRDGRVDIVDPAVGEQTVSAAAVSNVFTGVALLFEPAEGFRRVEAPRDARRFLALLSGLHNVWGRIVVASVALNVVALLLPGITVAVIDRALPRGDRDAISVLTMLTVCLGGLYVVTALVRGHMLVALKARIDVRLATKVVERLFALPYSYFLRRQAGDVLARVSSTASIREFFSGALVGGILDALLATGFLVTLALVAPKMLPIAVGLGAVEGIAAWVSAQRQRRLLASELSVEAKLRSHQVECIVGIETVKLLGAEQSVRERWMDLALECVEMARARGRLAANVDALMGAIRMVTPALLLLMGARTVLAHEESLGEMLAACALVGAFLGRVAGVASTLAQIQFISVQMARLDDVIDAPTEARSPTRTAPAPIAGRVTLELVLFAYGTNDRPALSEVSLDVRAGEFLAVVGASGSGKSTLAMLLSGLHRPAHGAIRIDGKDLATYDDETLRRELGVVPQRPSLFAGTIRDNIAFGAPNVALDEIVAAATLAQIHEEIEAMPMGYDTPLADQGASLSGGQRQRIALARVLLRRPRVLVLDEATSALDPATEQRVKRALDGLACTRIVIAHRLSTVANADRIVVLDAGRLVEEGTHRALVERGGLYARQWAA